MNGEFAGAADIITGAAIARAIEPVAGEGHGQSDICLNCGTALRGAHCHACGQKGDVHRTLGAFGHDILHSVLHFDGKIWRTLPMLFWNPGKLTQRYIHGERAKFVSPLALFLFTVFLTFAAFNWLVPEDEVNSEVAVQSGQSAQQAETAAQGIKTEKLKVQNEIGQLEAQIAADRKAGKPTQDLESELQSQKIAGQVLNAVSKEASEDDDTLKNFRFTDLNFPGAGYLNEAAKKATKNPQLLLYKMQSNTYKYSWALIPISAPFVWLLFFWRRQFKMFDHAVFVTYSLTFMMLLGIISALFISFPTTEVIGGLLLAFAPPLHMYRQLRYAYGISRLGAFTRMCLLSLFAMTALTLFAALVVTLGVA